MAEHYCTPYRLANGSAKSSEDVASVRDESEARRAQHTPAIWLALLDDPRSSTTSRTRKNQTCYYRYSNHPPVSDGGSA
jgi:hypothetical protein